jgi:hypothetical protein
MRRWRHNKAPMMKLLVPWGRYQRDEYINTMKVNFRIGDEMPINKHVAIFILHAWLTISFKVGFSWYLWIYLVDIFLVVLKVSSSDFWCVYEVFFFLYFLFLLFSLLFFFFCHIILFLAIRLLWFLSCHKIFIKKYICISELFEKAITCRKFVSWCAKHLAMYMIYEPVN